MCGVADRRVTDAEEFELTISENKIEPTPNGTHVEVLFTFPVPTKTLSARYPITNNGWQEEWKSDIKVTFPEIGKI